MSNKMEKKISALLRVLSSVREKLKEEGRIRFIMPFEMAWRNRKSDILTDDMVYEMWGDTYDGEGFGEVESIVMMDSIKLANARIRELEKLNAIGLDNYRNAWTALSMIRDAIEELGPVGALISGEAVDETKGPEPVNEAEALIEGIRKICHEIAVRDRAMFNILQVADCACSGDSETYIKQARAEIEKEAQDGSETR